MFEGIAVPRARTLARNAASSLRNSSATAERSISAGSRPTFSQWASSTAILCLRMSAVPHTFHSSACWAVIRRVTFSPPPPTINGRGSCTGFGSSGAPTNW